MQKKKKSSKALQLQWHIQQIRAVQQCLDQTQKRPFQKCIQKPDDE